MTRLYRDRVASPSVVEEEKGGKGVVMGEREIRNSKKWVGGGKK